MGVKRGYGKFPTTRAGRELAGSNPAPHPNWGKSVIDNDRYRAAQKHRNQIFNELMKLCDNPPTNAVTTAQT